MDLVVLAGALTLLLTMVSIVLLYPAARQAGLIDLPGGHKHHDGEVPLVGGLAMFLAFGSILFLCEYFNSLACVAGVAFFGAGLLLITGILDDLYGVSVFWRFLTKAGAGLLVVLVGGTLLTDLGHLLSPTLFTLGAMSVPLTLFVFMGGTSAMNMVDGLDGLAGGLALVTLLSLLIVAIVAGQASYMITLTALAGAVAGFLFFNFRWRRGQRAYVFMGNAGSLFLGFMITWYLIALAQEPGRVMTPVTALWVFAIPLMDTVRLLVTRPLRGQSPFNPAHDHLHHVLRLVLGMNTRQTVKAIIALQILFSAIGLAGLYLGARESLMFFAFVGMFMAYTLSLLAIDTRPDMQPRVAVPGLTRQS